MGKDIIFLIWSEFWFWWFFFFMAAEGKRIWVNQTTYNSAFMHLSSAMYILLIYFVHFPYMGKKMCISLFIINKINSLHWEEKIMVSNTCTKKCMIYSHVWDWHCDIRGWGTGYNAAIPYPSTGKSPGCSTSDLFPS